jgi:hypothetical protein
MNSQTGQSLTTGCRRAAPVVRTTDAGVSPTLAQEMIGTWVHVGSPGRVVEIPQVSPRLKLRTGTHWAVTHADESGLVRAHFWRDLHPYQQRVR